MRVQIYFTSFPQNFASHWEISMLALCYCPLVQLQSIDIDGLFIRCFQNFLLALLYDKLTLGISHKIAST